MAAYHLQPFAFSDLWSSAGRDGPVRRAIAMCGDVAERRFVEPRRTPLSN